MSNIFSETSYREKGITQLVPVARLTLYIYDNFQLFSLTLVPPALGMRFDDFSRCSFECGRVWNTWIKRIYRAAQQWRHDKWRLKGPEPLGCLGSSLVTASAVIMSHYEPQSWRIWNKLLYTRLGLIVSRAALK